MSWGVLESEVNADGGDVALLELVVSEATEDRGFADRRWTNDDKFEDVVVALLHLKSNYKFEIDSALIILII